MFTIFMPHQNLSCLGLRISNPWDDSQLAYMDVYLDTYGVRLFRKPYFFINARLIGKYTLGLFFIHKWR